MTIAALLETLHEPRGSSWYRLADDVDEETRFLARYTSRLCALELGLASVPRVLWFRELTAQDAARARLDERTWCDVSLRGRAAPERGAILVRCDMPRLDVLETIAHEIYHCFQIEAANGDERFSPFARNAERHERAAEVYGRRFREFLEGGRKLHQTDETVHRVATLEGVADTDDLLLAPHPTRDELALYRNQGNRRQPYWRRVSP